MPKVPYIDFSTFMARYFDYKVQKITVNAGFTCPNRDGTVGYGGCTYCNNQSFSPEYCHSDSNVAQQIEAGKAFFGRKYPSMGYIAYFQAYTNTHADTDRLLRLYNEALSIDGVEGLIIGTRPDCMPDDLLNRLAELATRHFVMIEYGAETANERTLQIINRCHTWQQTADAVNRTHAAGIPVGLHLINGLPYETEADILRTIDAVNLLPVDIIKCHQLQLIRGTKLALQVEQCPEMIHRFTVDEYIDLCCKIIHRLRPDIAIERFVSQSPDSLLIYPRWGLKNYQFTHRLLSRLEAID